MAALPSPRAVRYLSVNFTLDFRFNVVIREESLSTFTAIHFNGIESTAVLTLSSLRMAFDRFWRLWAAYWGAEILSSRQVTRGEGNSCAVTIQKEVQLLLSLFPLHTVQCITKSYQHTFKVIELVISTISTVPWQFRRKSNFARFSRSYYNALQNTYVTIKLWS